MNWTEGNLARHSRGKAAKNEVLRRQKQHFAKARSRLLNGEPRQSPIIISFLDSPIVRQPAEHVSSPEHDGPALPEDQHHSPSSRSNSNIERGHRPVHDPIEHRPRDPFISQPEITRNESSTKQPAARKAETTLERASREKRRKLLDKTDWAGLTMQQPLDLTFPGQMRVGRIWSNTSPADRGTTEKSRHFVRGRPANREKSIRYRNGDRRLQPTSQRIKVKVGSQDTYFGNGSNPLGLRRRWAGSDRGNSTEISTVISESSQTSSCRDDWVRQCRKSSSRSVDEDLMERRSNIHHSAREVRRSLEVASPSNSSSESSAAHVAYASLTLEEPAPQQGGKPQILERSSSMPLYSGSLEVEVGQPASRPDAMDIAENERWKPLGDSSDHLIPLTRGFSLLNSPHMVMAISPGISEMMTQNGKSDIELTRDAHAQVGERPSGEFRSAMAADVMTSVDDGGMPAAQTSRSQIASLGTSKSKHSKAQSDMEENMAWMKWVFDSDSDEFERCAMQEAARLAARQIRPSKSPEEIISKKPSTEYSRGITRSTESPEVSVDAFLESSDDVASTAVASASRMATHGSTHSPPSTANQTRKTNISCNSVTDTTPDEYPSLDSDTSAMHTFISDVETTKATMAISEYSEASKDNPQRYRFTAPQAFVGKHAQKEKLRRMQMPPPDIPDIARCNKRKGRRKKKASDGRMSIRELPNFDGDPIEDIEDD